MTDAAELHMAGRAITAEMRTSASADEVYAAWADPERLAQWFVDRARGTARPGECMIWVWDAFGMEVPYEVVAAEPGRRLVLRAPAGVAPPGVIELTIHRDAGDTVLTIVNSGFLDGEDWDEVYAGVRSGWTLALALLREYLEYHAGRAKRTFVLVRASPVGIPELQPWFTESALLRRWLATSAESVIAASEPARTGEPVAFRFVLYDGTPVTAHVLARTGRELALAFRDEAAVLELKAFTAPGEAPEAAETAPPHLRPPAVAQPIVCLRGTSWHVDPQRVAWLEDVALRALDRLVRELGV